MKVVARESHAGNSPQRGHRIETAEDAHELLFEPGQRRFMLAHFGGDHRCCLNRPSPSGPVFIRDAGGRYIGCLAPRDPYRLHLSAASRFDEDAPIVQALQELLEAIEQHFRFADEDEDAWLPPGCELYQGHPGWWQRGSAA